MINKAAKICAMGAILSIPLSTTVHAELVYKSTVSNPPPLKSIPVQQQPNNNMVADKSAKQLKREAEKRAKQLAEDQAKAKIKAEQLARTQAEQQLKNQQAAADKAAQLARQKAKDDKAKEKEVAKAKRDAEYKARIDAQNKAIEDEKAKRLKAKADAQAKREADKQARIDAQNKAEVEAKAKRDKEIAEAKAKQEAEDKARLDAKTKAQAKLKADAEARKKAKDDAQAQRVSENQARLDAQKKAVAESEAKIKAVAEAQKLAKENKLKEKAEAKAKRNAEIQAQADAKKNKADVAAKLKADSDTKTNEILSSNSNVSQATLKSHAGNGVTHSNAKTDSVVAPRISPDQAALEAFKAQQQAESIQLSILNKEAQKISPLKAAISNVSTVSAVGESALQKATSGLMVAPKNEKAAIRVQLFGFHATPEQKEKLNSRYAYATSNLTVMPEKIGNIKLRPRITLVNSKLEMFNTLADKKAAEEFFSYHPRHSQIFASYVTRIMTLNNGNTGGVTLDKGFMSELTYNFAETPVPSVSSMQKAQDQYLYITNRLTETDSIKFWNWINSVRDTDKIDIPDWVVLANILNS